ncbi:hypothetical protein [Kordiimonas laminariae]|uniref:hypothetical protein n=1 Tax=Kordiimonas laminariae TaxID=2917717 RepID=UPI001FF6F299|nr:hypothetical protein [Kordiimonas laminariae]MCK0069579.1 hypothetical protein [Kordiimonas laminariae]
MRTLLMTMMLLGSIGAVAQDQQEEQGKPKEQTEQAVKPDYSNLCIGDGCDAYLPFITRGPSLYPEVKGRKRLNSVLGGVAGAVLGEGIAGAPGAVGLGLLGAGLGYNFEIDRRYEEQYREQRKSWERGDDIYYNPSHPIPQNAHWLQRDGKNKKK